MNTNIFHSNKHVNNIFNNNLKFEFLKIILNEIFYVINMNYIL